MSHSCVTCDIHVGHWGAAKAQWNMFHPLRLPGNLTADNRHKYFMSNQQVAVLQSKYNRSTGTYALCMMDNWWAGKNKLRKQQQNDIHSCSNRRALAAPLESLLWVNLSIFCCKVCSWLSRPSQHHIKKIPLSLPSPHCWKLNSCTEPFFTHFLQAVVVIYKSHPAISNMTTRTIFMIHYCSTSNSSIITKKLLLIYFINHLGTSKKRYFYHSYLRSSLFFVVFFQTSVFSC